MCRSAIFASGSAKARSARRRCRTRSTRSTSRIRKAISGWQRDLTDSTVMRNVGVAFGYALLGYVSCRQGLSSLAADPARLAADLDANWEVLAEPIQTVMRRYGIDNPYEQLKALTRGKAGMTRETLHAFIDA